MGLSKASEKSINNGCNNGVLMEYEWMGYQVLVNISNIVIF